MRELKEYFISEIGQMENTVIHGVADEGSAPHIISLGVAGVRSEVLRIHWRTRESMYRPDQHVLQTIRQSAEY